MVRKRKTGWEHTERPEYYRSLDYLEKLMVAAINELALLKRGANKYMRGVYTTHQNHLRLLIEALCGRT